MRKPRSINVRNVVSFATACAFALRARSSAMSTVVFTIRAPVHLDVGTQFTANSRGSAKAVVSEHQLSTRDRDAGAVPRETSTVRRAGPVALRRTALGASALSIHRRQRACRASSGRPISALPAPRRLRLATSDSRRQPPSASVRSHRVPPRSRFRLRDCPSLATSLVRHPKRWPQAPSRPW